MKKKQNKRKSIKCKLGFHKWAYFELKEIEFKNGRGNSRKKKLFIRRICLRCNKQEFLNDVRLNYDNEIYGKTWKSCVKKGFKQDDSGVIGLK